MRTALLTVFLSLVCLSVSYAESGIEINDAWVRETPPGSTITAAYMNIENNGSAEDTLKSASSKVSKSAEIHKTSVDDKGVAKMEMVESVQVPSGSTVKLEPGGMHIMLIGLEEPIKSGDKVEVELVFENEGSVKVEAEVLGIGDDAHQHHHH